MTPSRPVGITDVKPVTGRPSETAQTLSRGLNVLKLIATAPSGLTLAQVAEQLELSRTIVYRLVATLIDHRLVRRGDDGVLRIAPGALALTTNIQPMLRDTAHETLTRLAAELSATTHLSIIDGDETVCIDVVEPPTTPFHIAYRVGARLPLQPRGYGRALLHARRDRWDYVATRGEIIPGVYGVTAAVPDLPDIEAAIGVISIHPLDVPAVGARLRAAVLEISAAF